MDRNHATYGTIGSKQMILPDHVAEARRTQTVGEGTVGIRQLGRRGGGTKEIIGRRHVHIIARRQCSGDSCQRSGASSQIQLAAPGRGWPDSSGS
jgi:hypothetical protein